MAILANIVELTGGVEEAVPLDRTFTKVDPTIGGVIVNEYEPMILPSLS